MSQPSRARHRRTYSIARAAALLALGLLFTACGFTDDAGTKYSITLASEDFPEDESLASIGAPMVGETVRVTFEVARQDKPAVDRTEQAVFRLENKQTDDDLSDFVFTPSTDLAEQPYHTLRSDVLDAKATLCVSYQGPEVLNLEPVETCMRVVTIEPAAA